MDYRETAKEVSKKVFFYLHDEEGWKVAKSTKQVKVLARPSNEFSGTLYRVEAFIDIPPDQFFPFIYLPEYRSKWDKSLQSYEIIQTMDENTFIYRSVTHSYGFGLISPRDFVYMVHIKEYDGNVKTTNSISMNHPDFPPARGFVRGTTFASGFACFPLPEKPEQCKFMAIVQVDLGGMLKPSLIDTVMPMTLINSITDCKAGIKMLQKSQT